MFRSACFCGASVLELPVLLQVQRGNVDAVTEPKPKRIKVKYGDVEQGIQISHDVSVEDSRKEIARNFDLSSDTLTLRDADGYAVVPSYGNVAHD